MRNTLAVMLVVLALTLSRSAQSSQCLIVRSAEGHRFRNSMIAGALTGGYRLCGWSAFSGAKYEYADSFNLGVTEPKYSGKDLEKLQSEGVHVIVVNKKTASAEMDSARNSCKVLDHASCASGHSRCHSWLRSYNSGGSGSLCHSRPNSGKS